MTDSQKRILEMLAENKITVDEAARLISAINNPGHTATATYEPTPSGKPLPKYLRVVVQPNTESGAEAGHEHVNIRVPIALIRAGIKLTALIPSVAADRVNEALGEKGFDLDLKKLKPEDLESLVDALSELEVDVKDKKEKVRIYLE